MNNPLKFSIVLVATLLMLGANASPSLAAELSEDQCHQIFDEANQAYQRGMAAGAEDPVEAKQEFETAVLKYQTLLDGGMSNGKLYFNLANACLHSGRTGRAIANYERAARLMPGSSAVQANLQLARQQLDDSSSDVQENGWQDVAKWHETVSPTVRLVIGISAWIALWAAAAGWLCWKRKSLKYVVAASAMVCVLCVVSLSIWYSQRPDYDQGVVSAKQVVLRVGDGETFASKYDQPLKEGQIFQVVSHRGDWLQARLADGRTGWLPSAEAEVILAKS